MAPLPKRKAALLIDVANCSQLDFTTLMRTARRYGDLVVTQAYANFASRDATADAAEKLFTLGVQLIHCPAWRNGSSDLKSTADEALMSQLLRLAQTQPSITRIILASGDGHYLPVVLEAKKRGREVIVITDRTGGSRQLEAVANRYIVLEPAVTRVPEAIHRSLAEATQKLWKGPQMPGIYASTLKNDLKTRHKDFDEKQYCSRRRRRFRNFTEFLEDAAEAGWVRLKRNNDQVLVEPVRIEIPTHV